MAILMATQNGGTVPVPSFYIYIYLSSNILLMFGDIGMISHLLLQALDPTDTDSHDDIPARNCRLTTINHCDLP